MVVWLTPRRRATSVKGYTLMKMQAYYLSAHRRHQSINALAERINFALKFFGRCLFHHSVGNEILLQLVMQLAVTHHVQALVAHARQQIRHDGRFTQFSLFYKQLGKDVVHNILAVVIVVQQHVSQPMHRTVMLPEQPLDMSFSVCHTLYIHTETDFLNPKRKFSRFFLRNQFWRYKITSKPFHPSLPKRVFFNEKPHYRFFNQKTIVSLSSEIKNTNSYDTNRNKR